MAKLEQGATHYTFGGRLKSRSTVRTILIRQLQQLGARDQPARIDGAAGMGGKRTDLIDRPEVCYRWRPPENDVTCTAGYLS